MLVGVSSPGSNTASVSCIWNVGDGELLTAQPPTLRDAETTMKDDVLRLPTGALSVTGETSALSLGCSTTSTNPMTLTATVVASQVSALQVR